MTLTHLHMTQFRSWTRLELDADARPVAIHGPNGAGKTNILEAVSMLTPGRGMRGALPGDQARKGPDVGWQIRATIDEYQVLTRALPGQPREVLVDDKPSPQIAVSVSETKVRFATPTITLTSKVIDGTFPDYSRVIPSGNTRKLEVDAGDFAKAVDRVATVSSERSRAVKLALDEDRLVLSVNAPDAGAADEELPVAYADEPLEIGFNAKYLHEIASQIERENAVFLFNGSGDAALIREGGDTSAVYVVMPMRV